MIAAIAMGAITAVLAGSCGALWLAVAELEET